MELAGQIELPGGRYEVKHELGSAGHGVSYLAVDTARAAPVVVRVFRSRHLTAERLGQRALVIAEALRDVDDHRVVPVHNAGPDEDDDCGYLVRDFVEGRTAEEAAARRELNFDELVELGIELGETLAAAHRAGVVHGDLKPSNLILTPSDELKIVDFGAADVAPAFLDFLATRNPDAIEITGLPSALRVLTETGANAVARRLRAARRRRAAFGPDSYAAPELVRGTAPDAPADLYSAGRVLDAVSRDASADAIASAGVPGRYFQQILGRLTAEDPAERMTAPELVEAMRAVRRALGADRGPSATIERDPDGERGTDVERGARFVNVWFESDEPVPPLVVGTWYALSLNVGPRRVESAGDAPLAEPDFGDRDAIDLLASLYSEDLDIEQRRFELRLPRFGGSEPGATTRVRARSAGVARLEIVLNLMPQLELVQKLEVKLAVHGVSVGAASVVAV